MTQTEKVLEHMKQYGSITATEAMNEYGIFRLASRISDMKKSGVPVRKRMIKAKNRFDEPVCFAEYSLEDESA